MLKKSKFGTNGPSECFRTRTVGTADKLNWRTRWAVGTVESDDWHGFVGTVCAEGAWKMERPPSANMQAAAVFQFLVSCISVGW